MLPARRGPALSGTVKVVVASPPIEPMPLKIRFATLGPAFVLAAAALALVVLSVRAHLPGQVSMDASMQLYEASLGRSITWNPPYMTAILRWLGGGPGASSWMVVFNSAVTYLTLALLAGAVLVKRAVVHRTGHGWQWLRAGLILLLLANPILYLYVGIVWKDVLFSSLLMLGLALGLAACLADDRRAAVAWAVGATVALAVAMKVRQQGIFMSPVLLGVPLIGLTLGRGLSRTAAATTCVVFVCLFAGASMAMSALVARTIQTEERFGNSVGYKGVMQYDIAGIVALSPTATDKLAIPMTEELRSEIRRLYTPDRGDFLWRSPAVTQWQSSPTYEVIKDRWTTLIRAEPRAYAEHKARAFAAVLAVDGVKACLPVHVGIDGNHEYLREIGFTPGVDARDQALWGLSQDIIRWPVYRHWVYVLALVVAAVALVTLRMPVRLRAGALVAALATALLYLSYLPTSIACDFRYLFAGICLVSLLWAVILAGAFGAPRVPSLRAVWARR